MGRNTSRDRFVGIDVSAKELHVALDGRDVVVFPNDAQGHKRLVKYVTKRGHTARVVLEATGAYHVDLACVLALHRHCEVMVANPRSTAHFHSAQGIRAKTDRVDALSLLQFAKRMSFLSWDAPSEAAMGLRSAARYVDQLVKERARIMNQIHAAKTTLTTPQWVLTRLQVRYDSMTEEIAEGQAELLAMARAIPELAESVALLDSVPGIAPATAVRMLAEFLFVSKEMTGKQITAWAGLDPRPRESGTSVRGRRSMSKRGNARMRRLLFMPAITAVRAKGAFRDLKERVAERSGSKMVGVGAVMRKLLVVSWAIYRTQQPWDASLVAPKKERKSA